MALGASYIYHRHVPGTKDIAEMRTNMELISRAMAQQIVDTVKDVCSQNINFIDEKGIIVASRFPFDRACRLKEFMYNKRE